jgi:hypothetical protein
MVRTIIVLFIVGMAGYWLTSSYIDSYNASIQICLDMLDERTAIARDSARYFEQEDKLSSSGTGKHRGEALQEVIDNKHRYWNKMNRYIERRNELAKSML